MTESIGNKVRKYRGSDIPLEEAYMIGIAMKIRNNKIVYLSKFLFLKNLKKPNGNKTKNIGKIARPIDLMKEVIPIYIVASFQIVDAAAIE